MKYFFKKISTALMLFLGAACVFVPAHTRAADDDWVYYESETGVFKSQMPRESDSKIHSLMVGDYKAVNIEKITSQLKPGIYNNIPGTYVVQFDQTFGPALNKEAIAKLIYNEAKVFENFYKPYGGVVLRQNFEGSLGQSGGELLISYNDPEKEKQFVDVKIIVSSSTRLSQIAIGSEESIESLRTKQFFDRFAFFDGLSAPKKKLRDVWKPLLSPLGLFTIYTPPENVAPFFPDPPAVKNTDKAEIISHAFVDPLRGESLFYNVYGYKTDIPLTDGIAKNFVIKNHIEKMRGDAKDVIFTRIEAPGASRIFDVVVPIPATKERPFLKTARLRLTYSGTSLVVQEILSSKALALSKFADSLMLLVDVHPQKNAPTTPQAPAVKTP